VIAMAVFAHIGHVAEPLMFLPAFFVVGWSLVASRRRTHNQEDPDA
jgi:hypothetical protein